MATIPSAERAPRIETLDIVRGVAVMGILAMNIVAFAMPFQAYLNPLAYGADSTIDLAVYAFNFVFIDGKMRGLFSFLFGASMLLVIGLADAKGENSRSVHFRRMAWLLVFGMLHFYLIWYGDILIAYALMGMVAWAFRDMPPRKLVLWAIGLLTMQLFLMSGTAAYVHSVAATIQAGAADPATLEEWRRLSEDFAVPDAGLLREDLALHLGGWTGIVRGQLTEELWAPLFGLSFFGWETLAYMLFGMAALKSGFLTGASGTRTYRKIILSGLAIGVPAYMIIAAAMFSDGFTVEGLFTFYLAATVPFRPLMVVAYAALIILATRGGGWLVDRIAAAGRAAFTNYLGTSVVMTGLFYGWGLGLYGSLGRAELWLVVLAMWLVMLAWSKPWLDRFNYGPFEWAWRSLARWKVQPMRKRIGGAAAAAGA